MHSRNKIYLIVYILLLSLSFLLPNKINCMCDFPRFLCTVFSDEISCTILSLKIIRSRFKVIFKWNIMLSIVTKLFWIHQLKEQLNVNVPQPVINGIEIPCTLKEAYLFDTKNGKTLWQDSINKETSKMETYKNSSMRKR